MCWEDGSRIFFEVYVFLGAELSFFFLNFIFTWSSRGQFSVDCDAFENRSEVFDFQVYSTTGSQTRLQ